MQSYSVYLSFWIISAEHTHFQDLSMISTTDCSVFLLFWKIFDLIFLPYSENVVSFLCNCRLFFLNPMSFHELSWLSSRVLAPEVRGSFCLPFVLSLNVRVELICFFFLFQHNFVNDMVWV